MLPGPVPGRSIGCFLPDPARPTGELPPLRLIGDGCNLGDATITEDSETLSARASALRLADGEVATFECRRPRHRRRPSGAPADLTPLRLPLPPSDAARRPDRDRHRPRTRIRLRLQARRQRRPWPLRRRADALRRVRHRVRQHALQRQLPADPGRAPDHAVAVQPELRGAGMAAPKCPTRRSPRSWRRTVAPFSASGESSDAARPWTRASSGWRSAARRATTANTVGIVTDNQDPTSCAASWPACRR